MSRPRRIATVVHRYTGLAIAGFLIVSGLTGALISWNDQLERVFAPTLFVLPPDAASRPPLDPFALREAAERATGFAVNGIDWSRRPDEPARFFLEARPGGPPPHDDEIALDPASGRVLGARRHGDLAQGGINLMPFVYALHENLALGSVGTTILGIVALLWTLDAFVGAYLTFPAAARHHRAPRRWLARWAPAWAMRWRRGGFRLGYDLHRAGGLWPWALLLLLAWSGVALNLPQVYRPVTAALFGIAPEPPLPTVVSPEPPPRLGWRAAHLAARRTMATLAAREGFAVRSERLMMLDPATRAYRYRALSDRDPGATGNTEVTIDGDTGRLLAWTLPTGQVTGTTLTTWIEDIHVGDVFGLPMRILLSVAGLATVSLSMTGIWVWWRKWSARRRSPHIRAQMTIEEERTGSLNE